ncbi:MAG TPA: hypothetical protein DCR93_15385 [Cytophagales bacterium]|nr:hypothetical protein [Cytophagales bacterium]
MPTTTGYEYQRGGHPFELRTGHHVVVAVFATYEGAERYTARLNYNGYPAAKFGYLSVREQYYVYISYSADDVGQARTERDRVRRINRDQFSKAWVLSVVDRE